MKKKTNICIDCKKVLGDSRSTRCPICASHKHSLYMIGKNNPMFGKHAVNYKGGKPHCFDCGHITSRRGTIRCMKCFIKWSKIPENNPNYIDGNSISIHYCIDCGNKVIDYHAKRCLRCSNIMNSKLNATRIKYKDIFFKSSWEVAYAKYLDKQGIKWLYEPKTFDLGNTTYTPDFYLPKTNLYIEIKGYFRPDARKKVNLFKKLYSEEELLILKENNLRKLGVL